ncbi:MAG: hypothetical protein ACOZAA_18700 [Pseudomonadota bacterium]
MQLWSRLALVLLAVAGCSRADLAPQAVDGDALVTIEQRRDDPWRVSIELKTPRAVLDLGPSIESYRERHWRLEGESARLVARDGRDFVEATGAGRKFRSLSFLVEPAPVDLRKDYEPFVPMGDGAVLIYSGHFMPFRDAGTRMDAKLTVIAEKGAAVSAFGETAPRFENWESPYRHPAFIYLGSAAPAGEAISIADKTAPQWIKDEVASFAPAIAEVLTDMLERSLPSSPNIFVVMGDLSEEGRLSYSGDALPGQYQMTLAGGAWKVASPQALGVLRLSTAHEAAHLFQAAARPKSDAVPDWIHEGGAEALAAEAMLAAGYWSAEEAAAHFADAQAECAASLEQLSLQRAEAEARWDAVYSCGRVLNVAAAGKGGVVAFWREFVRRAANEGYDEAMFLALAEESAGIEVAGAIRDLIRINDARPDLAIGRMLVAGAAGLEVEGGR